MAEEGLNYTIRFIPDTTEIDKSISEISDRISKELQDSIGKAKEEAGSVGQNAGKEMMEQFQSVTDTLFSTIKEMNILGGKSRSLQHPSSATVGSITQLAAQKMQSGDASQLTTDQILQVLSGAIVAGGRATSAKEVRPGMSTTEAIEESMQDQIGSLKGIAEGMFGLKEFKSMKGIANMTRLADFYERSSADTGKGRSKQIQQGLMEAIGHDTIQNAMKQIMQQEMGKADWEETQMKYYTFAKGLGMSEQEAKGLPYANQEVMDVIRKIGDVFQIGEAKPVGEASKGVPKFVRDLLQIQDVLDRTGNKDMKVMAKMYAGASQGTPKRAIEDFKTSDQIETGYEEIGEPVKKAIIRAFQQDLPDMQRELETLLIDMTPGAAKSHVEQLLFLIEEGLSVLEAHSLPDFWVRIGMPQWIEESAISYVNTLKEEIEPRVQSMLGEEIITDVPTSESGSGSGVRPIESERILGKLGIMDVKLDQIRNEISGRSGDGSGGLIGDMKTYMGE